MRKSLIYNKKILSQTFIHDPLKNVSVTYNMLFSRVYQLINRDLKGIKDYEKVLIISSDIFEILPFLIAGWNLKLKIFICSPNLKQEEYKELVNEFKFIHIYTNNYKLQIEPNPRLLSKFKLNDNFDSYSINYNPDDLALILFSSGTTGRQKAIPLSFNNLISNIKSFKDVLPISEDSQFLCTSPVWLAHGLYNSFLTALFLKKTVIYSGALNLFNSIKLLEYCKNYRNIIYHLTPSMLSILISASKRFTQSSLPKFDKVICGTSFLDMKSKKNFERIYKQSIYQQYGMTEVLFISLNDSPKIKPNSVGKPLPSVKLDIYDYDSSSDFKIGKIRVKSPSYYGKYINEPDIKINNKGFFDTGDLGYLDKDGYLFITGREKDLIKKGGLAISSEKLNLIIKKYNGINKAVTISRIDSKEGEEIYSFIVAKNTIDIEDLKRHIKNNLSVKFVPKFILQLQEIPTNEMGKTSYKELQNMIPVI